MAENEMVERVARDIASQHRLGNQYVATDGSRHDSPPWEGWKMHARAAIIALHEPTKAMIKVADAMIDAGYRDARTIYCAMIDEALRDG